MTVPPDPKPYQAHLEAWRVHRGMTQERVAEELGVAHTTVGRWERGAMAITSKTLVDLCRLYKVTPQQLLAPPLDAPMIERVAEIQGLIEGMDDKAFEHLIFFAKKIT